MQNRKIRESRSRLFVTLYKGRYRIVTRTTWFLDNGTLAHRLELTDTSGEAILKRIDWSEENSK